MVSVSMRINGAERAIDRLEGAGPLLDEGLRRLVRHHAHLLRTRIMANASGRPGPNAPSGDYRRSLGVETFSQGSQHGAIVGTDSPQGFRLEFGFHGRDSLGRNYDQPPFPHFGPAVDATAPGLYDGARALVREVLG